MATVRLSEQAMLNELTTLQESDERIWRTADVSLSIETRDKQSGELIERTYRFSHAKQFDTWTFTEFTEKRTEDTAQITNRNWRITEHAFWHKPNEIPPDIAVPPEVQRELKERLDADKLVFQQP